MTRVNLVFARAANGVIGRNNALPWHLPEDMAHFRKLTTGAPVIMGRKTWDSLPPRYRPLPNRVNIVVTRQTDWSAEGAVRALTVAEAVLKCEDLAVPEVWVIGGAQIYEIAVPFATRAIVTEIDREFEGDAFAPVLDAAWRETARESHVSVNGFPFSFVTMKREPARA